MSNIVTASAVRTFLSDEKRLSKMSPEAQATVVGKDGKAPRGRLHPQAIKAYNRGRKADRQYVEGAGKVVKAEAKAKREAHVASGGGKRGPFPKAQAQQVATPKA